MSHSQLLKFLFWLFTMFTLIKVSSIHLQNNTRGAHTECQFKGEYPTSSSIDIDILCFVIEYPVMFLSSLSGDKHDDMFCGDSTKRNNKHPLVHQQEMIVKEFPSLVWAGHSPCLCFVMGMITRL